MILGCYNEDVLPTMTPWSEDTGTAIDSVGKGACRLLVQLESATSRYTEYLHGSRKYTALLRDLLSRMRAVNMKASSVARNASTSSASHLSLIGDCGRLRQAACPSDQTHHRGRAAWDVAAK